MNTTHETADTFAHRTETHNESAQSGQKVISSPGFKDPRRKSSFLAALLSLVPGLGQVYVGYYRRGFINILTFGSVFSILVMTEEKFIFQPLGAMFLIFFELFNIIDAGRRATLFNLSLDGIEDIDLPDELTNKPMSISGSYLWGTVLLLLGVIALSNTLFDISLAWLNEWWPVFPTAFGAYLVLQAWKDGQTDSEISEEKAEK